MRMRKSAKLDRAASNSEPVRERTVIVTFNIEPLVARWAIHRLAKVIDTHDVLADK